MTPTAITRSLQWAGFKTHSLTITTLLHSRQEPQTENGTVATPPGPRRRPQRGSPIPGLNRSVFIVVIVAGVVVLILAIFSIICCWQRRKRNRLVAPNMRQADDLELIMIEEPDRSRRFGDTPRPDSTTLPMQGALLAAERTLPLPPINGSIGSPLDSMLNRFNTSSSSRSGSHRRLRPENSGRNRITWDNDIGMAISTTSPTSPSSNYQEILGSRSSTPEPISPPPAILRSPTIESSMSDSPRISSVARGKQPVRHVKSPSSSSQMSSKIWNKKKTRPVSEITISRSIPDSPMSTFGGFGRASVGSMSGWVSWWESSSDEDGETTTKRKKRKK